MVVTFIMYLCYLELEKNIENEKREYEDLTAKYEILEEEHVVTKAKLVMEKEALSKCVILQFELNKFICFVSVLQSTTCH